MTQPTRYTKSGRRCTICRLASRAQIEAALALGLSCASVAAKFQLGPDAVWRHRRHHMDPSHMAAVLLGRQATSIDFEELQRVEADRILSEVVDQRIRLRAVRDMALGFGRGGLPLVLAAESSIRASLELEIRLLAPVLGARLQSADVSPRITRIERVIIDDRLDDVPGGAADAVEPLAPEQPPPRPTPVNVVRFVDTPSSLFGRQGSDPLRGRS